MPYGFETGLLILVGLFFIGQIKLTLKILSYHPVDLSMNFSKAINIITQARPRKRKDRNLKELVITNIILLVTWPFIFYFTIKVLYNRLLLFFDIVGLGISLVEILKDHIRYLKRIKSSS